MYNKSTCWKAPLKPISGYAFSHSVSRLAAWVAASSENALAFRANVAPWSRYICLLSLLMFVGLLSMIPCQLRRRRIQWLQWLQWGVTFSQAVLLIGCWLVYEYTLSLSYDQPESERQCIVAMPCTLFTSLFFFWTCWSTPMHFVFDPVQLIISVGSTHRLLLYNAHVKVQIHTCTSTIDTHTCTQHAHTHTQAGEVHYRCGTWKKTVKTAAGCLEQMKSAALMWCGTPGVCWRAWTMEM